jgi:hypothetical protein
MSIDGIKKWIIARHWWCTSVILATQGHRDQENCGSKPAQAIV